MLIFERMVPVITFFLLEKQTPGSSKQKKTPISSKTKTPSNKTNLRKTVNVRILTSNKLLLVSLSSEILFCLRTGVTPYVFWVLPKQAVAHLNGFRLQILLVIIVITSLPSCLGQDTAKSLSVFKSSCHLSTRHGGGFTLSLIQLNVKAGKLWLPVFIVFVLSRPWIEPEFTVSVAYSLSIHSTTDLFLCAVGI